MKKTIIVSLIFLLMAAILGPIAAMTELDSTVMSESSSSGDMTGQEMTPEVLSGSLAETERTQENVPEGTSSGSRATDLSGGSETPPVIFIPTPHLIISEVFFDGSDEWFEIANIGSGDFVGSLSINGVKSSELHLGSVSIPSGGVFVRGDTMAQISNKSMIHGSGLGLSISDSAALHLSLSSAGILLDSFDVDALLVSTLANNYSFEKARSGSSLVAVATSTGSIANISGSRIANPGNASILTQPLIHSVLSSEIPISNAITGTAATGASSQPPQTGLINDCVYFSEVHPGSDALPEYIELYAARMFHGSLTVKGLGSSSASKVINVHMFTGQYLVVSDMISGFADTNILLLDSISLTDGGEMLSLQDSSGNVYDNLIYTGSSTLRSRYRFSGEIFSSSSYPTPGFSQKALDILPLIGSSEADPAGSKESMYYEGLYRKWKDRYYELKDQLSAFDIAVNTAGMAYRKTASSAEVELIDGSEEFDAPSLSGGGNVLSITSVLADAVGKDNGNEQVTIALLSGTTIDLSQFLIHANSKKTFLTGVLLSGESHTLKGNFGFTNKPLCITLEKGEIVYDTFCYGQPKAGVRASLSGDITEDPIMSGVTDFDRMKKLHFSLSTGQACAIFGETPFSCLSLKGISDDILKAKYTKKVASLQTKYDKKQRQYTGLQERYKSMKTSLDTKRRKYYQQVKTVRSSYKEKLAVSKLESKIRKSYGQLLQNDLKNNRYLVWQNSNIAFIQSLLDSNIDALKSEGTGATIYLDGATFRLGDLKKQFSFATDPGVVIDILIGKGLENSLPSASIVRDKRLTIRYAEEQ